MPSRRWLACEADNGVGYWRIGIDAAMENVILIATRNRATALLIYISVGFLTLLGIGNGLFMLISPEAWYYTVPNVRRASTTNISSAT